MRISMFAVAIALSASLFGVGCGSESQEPTSVEQSSEAVTTAPTATAVEGVKRYPPHGYPCLGCHPCGTSYCDDFSNAVVCTGNGTPVASTTQTK